MAIGIDIRVNHSQVAAAKREVGFLNDSLRDTKELSDITIAPKGMGELVGELKQIGTETRAAISGIGDIAAEMRRLQGMGGFRIEAPDMSRLVDEIRQVQGMANRAASPRQQATQQPPAQPRQPEQQQASEKRQSVQERMNSLRPAPPAEKPISRHDRLTRTTERKFVIPPAVTKHTSQAAQEQPDQKPVEAKHTEPQKQTVIPPAISKNMEHAARTMQEPRGVTKPQKAPARLSDQAQEAEPKTPLDMMQPVTSRTETAAKEQRQDRRQNGKPEPAEKNDSHYLSLIRTPQRLPEAEAVTAKKDPLVSPRTEQVAKERRQPEQPHKPVESANRPEPLQSVTQRTEKTAKTTPAEKPLEHFDRLIRIPQIVKPEPEAARQEQKPVEPNQRPVIPPPVFSRAEQPAKKNEPINRSEPQKQTAVPPAVGQRVEQAARVQPAPTQQRRSQGPVEPASRPEPLQSVTQRTVEAAASGGTGEQSERYTSKTAAALAATQKQSAKLKADLKEVLQDLKGIEKASHSIDLKPSTRATMFSEVQQLEARKAELEKEITRTDKRVEVLQTRQTVNNQVQQERGTAADRNSGSEPGGRNNNQFMRRALGWGLAAAGVGTIAGFIGSSRSSYRSAIDEEGPLHAKGLTGSRGRASMAAGMGINPGEYYALENSLSRTGITEKNMGKNAMATASFSKFAGLDTAEVAGLRGNLYAATGSNETIPNGVILAMSDATKKGLDKARLPELLGLIGRNTNATAQAMHGAGVDSQQIGAITRLSVAALSLKDSTSYKPFAKSEAFQAVMQNGLQGAGTGAGDIRLFQLMGGFRVPMTFDRIHEMNLTKQGGFMQNPELLTKLIGGLSSTTKAGKAGELSSLMKDWNIEGKAAEKLIEMFDSGFLKKLSAKKGQTIESMAKGGDSEAKRWLEEMKQNPALGRQAQEAKADVVKIEAGQQLSKLFLPLESAATEMAGSLASGDWKKSFSILDKAAGEMGTVGKIFVTGAGLIAAGGAMNMIGGAMSMGKGGIGALGMLSGPGGILASIGLGGFAATQVFKNGGQGSPNWLPPDRLNAITSKPPAQPTSFGGRLNPEVANNPRLSPGYKKHAVKIAEAAKKHGVPEPLLAGLIESESDFKNVPPRSVKMKNGKSISVGGVSQMTEDTAKQLKVNRMDPAQAIDGAARLLSDLHKKTGDWRESVKQYKGVQSKETEPQADAAFMKAEKYVRTEPERSVIQQATGGSDPVMQMVYDMLKTIAGHSEATAKNTAYQSPVARAPRIGPS